MKMTELNFSKLFTGRTRLAVVDFGYAMHMEGKDEYFFEADPSFAGVNQFPVFDSIRIGNEIYIKAGAKLINKERMDAQAAKMEAERNERGNQ